MKKDVIYIDIEDDITAVIEKLKNSSEKIIALVPPKGNAVLQSVVNLKLLKRAADGVDKQPVIVTNNPALTALAGGLELYVAKNLQSKPALPSGTDAALAEEADVEVSDPIAEPDAASSSDLDSDEVNLGSGELAGLAAENEAAAKPTKKASKADKKKSKKIPNFNNFRKKLLIIGGAALLLLIILVAVFGRTKASIVVRAETTPVDVAFETNINSTIPETNAEAYSIKAQRQQSQKTISQTITATGQKDLGTKASGTMSFSIKCSDVSGTPPTIPAGTGVSAGGLTFVTQSSASLTTSAFNPCRFTGSSNVVAQSNGDQYNLSSRSYTVAGYSSVSANGSQMSGGTTQIAKVISQGDVDKAKAELAQQDSSGIKKELTEAFGDNIRVFDDSFVATLTAVTSEPAVGAQANEGKVTAQASYSLLGVNNGDLEDVLEAFVKTKMTNVDQQQVYQNGLKNARFEKIAADDKAAQYKITTVAQYGPKFDIEELKQKVTGKKSGEVRATLQDLPGVKSVELNFSPFWANKTPNPDRIDIKLDVDENISG